MQSIEIKGWIFAVPNCVEQGKFNFTFFNFDVTQQMPDYVKVCEHKIVTELPADFDPTLAQIEALKAQRERVRAELGRRIAEIEDQIGRLTAIEYTPGQEAA
jgi:hypothetical protein